MTTPFIRLPIAAQGVATISKLDVADYHTTITPDNAVAYWDLREGSYSLASFVDSSDLMFARKPSLNTWSSQALIHQNEAYSGLDTGFNATDFTNGFTVAIVVRVNPDTVTTSKNSVILSDYQHGLTDSNGFYVVKNNSGQLALYTGTNAVGSEFVSFLGGATSNNTWLFLAISVSNEAGVASYNVMVSDATGAHLGFVYKKSPKGYPYIPPKNNIHLGTPVNGTVQGEGVTEYAEAAIYSGVNSEAQMQSLYDDAKKRMLSKGIAI